MKITRKPEKRGLGRGLSALLADVDVASTAGLSREGSEAGVAMIPIERIRANPDQPRRDFQEEDLKDLTDSVREKGVLQPLIVRPDPTDQSQYQIVAGERRWRAAQRAQLHVLPVLVRDYTDLEVLEIGIIENVQRADLNPVEEAMGYRQLMDKFGHTQEKLASALGKSRSHLANLLRLLNLPDPVLTWLREGKLSAGHARALVTAEKPEDLAARVIRDGLSVRETERLAKQVSDGPRRQTIPKPAKDADTRALESDLRAQLGLRVEIVHRANGAGELRVAYTSLDELDGLCQLLSSPSV